MHWTSSSSLVLAAKKPKAKVKPVSAAFFSNFGRRQPAGKKILSLKLMTRMKSCARELKCFSAEARLYFSCVARE